MHNQIGVGYSPNRNNPSLPRIFKFCAGQIAIASLVTMAIPSRPANAFTDFQICTAQLIRYATVSPGAASVACADALNPKDISRCVVTIAQISPTLNQEALFACTRVRRPVELGRCVFDITNRSRGTEAPRIIEYCRRSLLPERFSQCVTGISREVDAGLPRALDSCLAAEDFPRNLSPNFAPPPPQNIDPSSVPLDPRTLPLTPPATTTPIPRTPSSPGRPINPVRP